jgi:mannosyltransferase
LKVSCADYANCTGEHSSVDSSRLLRTSWVLLAVVLAIAAETRFLGLTDRSLWFDEAFSVSLTKAPVSEIIRFVRLHDTHPPLYYYLLKGWVGVFGSGEFAVRSLSALFGFLTVPLLYAFAMRLVDRHVALVAAALLAGSAFAAHASQEARMYPLLGLLALCSWYSLLLALRDMRARYWMLYVASAALMLYSHYFGFLVLGSQTLYLAPRLWHDRRTARIAAIAQAAVILIFVPLVPVFLTQFLSGRGWPTFRPAVGMQAVVDTLGLFAFGGELFGTSGYFHGPVLPTWQAALLAAPFLCLVGAGVHALRGRQAWLLCCYWVAPILGTIIISQRINIFYSRYFSFLAPAWALLMAAGMDWVARALPRSSGLRSWGHLPALAGLVILVLAANAPVINGYVWHEIRGYDWRAAAEVVSAQADPKDYLLYVPGFARAPFEYYYKGKMARFSLDPVELFQMIRVQRQPDPSINKAWARSLAEAHPHLWIVATVPLPGSAFLRLRNILADSFAPGQAWDFQFVYVFELTSRFYHGNGEASDRSGPRDRLGSP